MLRRFAGWLMALQEPRERPSIACSIGWHRPGEIRSRGRFYPSECVEPGCPTYIAKRALLSAVPTEDR